MLYFPINYTKLNHYFVLLSLFRLFLPILTGFLKLLHYEISFDIKFTILSNHTVLYIIFYTYLVLAKLQFQMVSKGRLFDQNRLTVSIVSAFSKKSSLCSIAFRELSFLTTDAFEKQMHFFLCIFLSVYLTVMCVYMKNLAFNTEENLLT